ncbi:unnamed protein product [Pleuronectes platessa]|uniref:Uncharacterized protein n=1 Tax=Pleuronectes platessa TaxID=8262 RepID=A0A9N7Z388_PLEPL|nr:unnamed protein product [Pleuronectes platessa]
MSLAAAESSEQTGVCVTAAVSSLRQRELGRLLRCAWIKRALFIGPLPLCSLLISGSVCDCSLKCLRDLLTPRRRGPLRPHTGSLQPPQREDQDRGRHSHCS